MYRLFKSSREISLLRTCGGTAALIAGALDDTMRNRFTIEESGFISAIERLRRQMMEKNQQVTVVDFGAGEPGEHHSEGEMCFGRTYCEPLRDLCRNGMHREFATLMLKLIRALNPETVLELGTCVGISAAYQTAGLELNGRGRLLTLEGSPAVAALATDNLRELGLRRAQVTVGRFSDTLPEVLQQARRIDFAFIDGHHDYKATVNYFSQIKPYLGPSAVVVFDDIAWSEGMAAAWKEIVADPSVSASVDLFVIGICVLERGEPKRNFRVGLA